MTTVFVTAGAKRFVIADLAKCDVRMLDHLRMVLEPTNFDALLPLPSKLEIDFLLRKADAAMQVAVPLLAAMLLPAGHTERDWTRALVRRNERYLRGLTGETQQTNVRELARLCAARLLDAAAEAASTPPPTLH